KVCSASALPSWYGGASRQRASFHSDRSKACRAFGRRFARLSQGARSAAKNSNPANATRGSKREFGDDNGIAGAGSPPRRQHWGPAVFGAEPTTEGGVRLPRRRRRRGSHL